MTVAETSVPKKLNVGRIALQSFTLTARAAPVLIPLALLSEALGRGLAWLVKGTNPLQFMATAAQRQAPSLLQSLVILPDQFLRGIVYAVMVWAAYTVYRGGRATPAIMFAAWSRSLGPVAAVSLAMAIVSATVVPLNLGLEHGHTPLLKGLFGFGVVLWAIAYAFFALAFWIAANVAIVEGCDAVTAFRRSAALTRGNRWRILWITVLVGLSVIVAMFVTWGIGGVGVPPRVALHLWTPIGAISYLLQIAIGALLSSSSAIIYAQRSAAVDPAPHAEVFS